MNVELVLPHLTGKTYKEVIAAIEIDSDGGDCCGWGEATCTDALADIAERDNATLVQVTKITYDSELDQERVVMNFLFDIGFRKGLILGYELTASSGSGWSYGAYCSLEYDGKEVARAQW